MESSMPLLEANKLAEYALAAPVDGDVRVPGGRFMDSMLWPAFHGDAVFVLDDNTATPITVTSLMRLYGSKDQLGITHLNPFSHTVVQRITKVRLDLGTTPLPVLGLSCAKPTTESTTESTAEEAPALAPGTAPAFAPAPVPALAPALAPAPAPTAKETKETARTNVKILVEAALRGRITKDVVCTLADAFSGRAFTHGEIAFEMDGTLIARTSLVDLFQDDEYALANNPFTGVPPRRIVKVRVSRCSSSSSCCDYSPLPRLVAADSVDSADSADSEHSAPA